MPGFDQSGPMGQGSQTGRGMGQCNPNAPTTDQYAAFGRGMGFRRGCGAGFGGGGRFAGAGRGGGRGAGFFGPAAVNRQPVAPVDEQESLRAQADQLQQSLAAVQQRLDALEVKE
ncbi:DUF5320 domain-containing protein [Desulforhopalus vacuolatus]|uniref:DUF5320 domain-containing protein n=1 Tax=Desulforhopalus vacuolatus TaxID=40414 RepID=UPI0019660261|nr:DUF5320 domain-containing protein [Desulforhopalus vacuolatus]MBM9520730.1 DUF5320 domain-containing protein [Desulforhopalus vacuolatus]